ncbi:DUF302 domain-containing protein [Aquimarina agarivorans]|uniref:DUF302 domain-containing protein n=1 Tax=Aquimarina agarivorans TaxID=980584 RepID=UPI000248EF74|nr:DUF302 domain-containing protein [Aquimarina agarivorans]
MKIIVLIYLALTFFPFSCKNDDDIPTEPETPQMPNIVGMNFLISNNSFNESYANLKNSLEANENIKIVAEVNHQANAASVDLDLNPTRVIFFGNPNLGTPLMQKNQLAGLDLPQKILVYQDDKKDVFMSYNNTLYLSSRHDVLGVPSLTMISGALKNLTTNASGNEVVSMPETSTVDIAEGIVTKTSEQSFDATYAKLQGVISNNPNLRIIAEVNHQANAANVGKKLNPTRLLIFGNPNLGTPLMQNAQTTALDLPQKMLVWEDDNKVVHVSYNNPSYLVKRHGITENETVIETISNALNNLSNAAITE